MTTIARATIGSRTASMNGLERDYALFLDTLIAAREIERWDFQALKLRLADGAWYTPDFILVNVADCLECHEVKGFWRESARVRIKVAASLHPYVFRAVTRSPRLRQWTFECFTPGAGEFP